MLALLLPLLLAAAPFEGGATLPAPLGRIGDVVEAPSSGGYPPEEKVLLATLPGCGREQALHLSRFLSGVALAGGQIQQWLEGVGDGAPQGLSKKLFGKTSRLIEAVRKAAQARPGEGGVCEKPVPAEEGWRLSLTEAPPKLCKNDASALDDHWFVVGTRPSKKSIAAVILVRPSHERAADRCRPRLSAVLFDADGVARLRYHADYGGELSAELLGDRCQAVSFTFAPKLSAFEAAFRRGGRGCTGAVKKQQ
ncbi:MAG: hypothetical protein ACOZIN_00395 [Myxococcota bacterium]